MMIENYDNEYTEERVREMGFVPGYSVFKNLNTGWVMCIDIEESPNEPTLGSWVYIGVVPL